MPPYDDTSIDVLTPDVVNGWSFEVWEAANVRRHPGGPLRKLGPALVECADRKSMLIRVDDEASMRKVMRRSGFLYSSAVRAQCEHLVRDGLLSVVAPDVWFFAFPADR
jgi:hypothetical protein